MIVYIPELRLMLPQVCAAPGKQRRRSQVPPGRDAKAGFPAEIREQKPCSGRGTQGKEALKARKEELIRTGKYIETIIKRAGA